MADVTTLFVFLLYRDFDDLLQTADAYVVPAPQGEHMKRPWFQQSAVYYTGKHMPADLANHREAWGQHCRFQAETPLTPAVQIFQTNSTDLNDDAPATQAAA